MKISDFLSAGDVVTDSVASEKRQLLQEVAQKAALALKVPADQIAAALCRREELGSTGTGGGVAIPHTKIQAVTKPFGILVKLRQPMDFDAIDSQPVDIVFMLLLPIVAKGDHLRALASIARRLREPEILRRLRRAKNGAEVYAIIIE